MTTTSPPLLLSSQQTIIPTGPGSGKGIDAHPYSRGSVIEVLYVKRPAKDKRTHGISHDKLLRSSEDADTQRIPHYGDTNNSQEVKNRDHWEDDSDSEISDWFASDEDDDEIMKKSNANYNGLNVQDGPAVPNHSSSSNTINNGNNSDIVDERNVHLADVIDRVALHPHLENSHPQQRFRYYIHYRNFNRRMDEWITMERIISPPSVGNSKVRAIKRKEERKRREEEERKERDRILNEVGYFTSLTTSSSTTLLVATNSGGGGSSSSSSATIDTTTAGVGCALDASGVSSVVDRPLKRIRRAASSTFGVIEDGSTTKVGEGWDATTSTIIKQSSSMGSEMSEVEAGRLTRRRSTAVGVASEVANTVSSGAMTTSSMMVAEEHIAVDVVTTIAAPVLDEHEGMDAAALKEHEEVTKVKNVNTLELGKFRMDTWYFSPLPKELLNEGGMIDVLYVDEFSFNFFVRKEELQRFQSKTYNLSGKKASRGSTRDRRHPPGNEIYRCGNLSMFEVDGFEERIYCQNLCYIAKLFLDHKTLYFDVDPFLFYVLCEVDERGYHPVGYYSKEKYSDVGYNLACILTFPSHQRKGYGRFLIAFSYELSKMEEKVGSPEKPMSDLGQQAYIPYWTSTIVDFLLNHSDDSKSMSIMDIAKKTSIMAEDIIFALNTLGILKFVNGVYFIYAERTLLASLAKKHPVKEPRVDPDKLHWTPYITDVKRDKFSISSKKASLEADTGVFTAN